MKRNFPFVILLFPLICVISWFIIKGQQDSTAHWCVRHNETMVSSEYRVLRTGPFWPLKNTFVYRVTTKEGNIYWFRYGRLFGDKVYKEVDGHTWVITVDM